MDKIPQCPACSSQNLKLLAKKNKYLCLDCEEEFDRGESLNQQGFTHFTGMEEVNQLAVYIKKNYPSVIGERVDFLFNTASSYAEKCSTLKSIYYITTQFIGLIACSYYLNDPDSEPDKQIQNCLASICMPVDSTWKELIVNVNAHYKTNDKTHFFIPEFSGIIDRLSDPMYGYPNAVYGGIKFPQYKKASVLQAGVDIRNAIHHETNPLVEEDFKGIYPFYLDIVFTLLKTMNFLDGKRFKYISWLRDNNFELLHGIGDKESIITIDIKSLEKYLSISHVFIFDSLQNKPYPLFPFILKFEDLWKDEKEFIFNHLGRKNANYAGRRSGAKVDEQSGYTAIKNLTLAKRVELNFDYNKLNFRVIKEFSQQSSWETLNNGYLGKKYFPACYIRPHRISEILNSFLDSNHTALFLTGSAGIGKSALLADLAYNSLQTSQSDVMPVFINGRDIKKREGLVKPIFSLLRENLMLKSNLENAESLLQKIHQEINQDKTIPSNTKIAVIIDAVNESFSTTEIFDEIDELVSKTWNHNENRSRFPWLKIIYSIRSTGYNELTSRKKGEESIFRNETPYMQVPVLTEIKEDVQVKYTAVIEIPPLSVEEINKVFKSYINDQSLFPVLSSRQLSDSIIDNKLTYLGNPLFLRFYLNLLERNKGEDVDIGSDGEKLFNEYYHTLCNDEEVKHFIHSLCYKMVEEVENPAVATIDIIDIILSYNELAENKKNHFYTNPLEKLLSEGILDRRSRAVIGQPPEEFISFTQQRFHEYAVYQYLINQYGTPGKQMLGTLLNKTADFDEYNNAISMIMNELWHEERIDEICRIEVNIKKERYTRVVENAIFDELEGVLVKQTPYERINNFAEDYKRKLELLTADSENFNWISDILSIFLWEADERFRDRIGGFSFYRYSIECSKIIAEELRKRNPDSAEYARDLSVSYDRIGDIYTALGDTKSALESYESSLKIREELRKRNPDSAEYASDMSISYSKIGDIYEALGDTKSALESYESSLKLAEELRKRNPDSAKYARDLSVSYSKIGDIYKALGDTRAALESYTSSLKIAEDLRKRNPDSAEYARDLAFVYYKLFNLYADLGEKENVVTYKIKCRDIIKYMLEKNMFVDQPVIKVYKKLNKELDKQ